MQKINSSIRFIKTIIKKKKKISLKDFSLSNEISVRTAQRYNEDLLEIFEENIVKEGDFYSLFQIIFLEKKHIVFLLKKF